MTDEINLSLCMIVRDNERTIRPCLESIRPWVDEMVIVDTGSRDTTPDIVRSLGARLFERLWTDDFSAARNFSIDDARGKWVFWMDSDDTIPPSCGEKLQQLARSARRENVLGYVMQVRCPSNSNSGLDEFTVVDHVKMFRNRPDLRFEGPIHEQLMMPIRRLGGEISWADIYVVHSGSDPSPESNRRKIERDLRILRKDLEQRPDHPFVLFNFAMTFAEANQFEEALCWVERCLAASQPNESHVRKAYAYLANCLFQLGRTQDAMGACKQGRQLYPDDPELLFREAMIWHELGQFDESISRYREILNLPKRDVFQSADPGIRDFKCRFNLGLALRDANRPNEAEIQWRTVLREKPGYRPASRALIDLLLANSRITTAQVEAERMIEDDSTRAEGLLLLVRVFEHLKDFELAESTLNNCLELFPANEQILEANSRFHFTHSKLEKAKQSLEMLVSHFPTNAAAYHNLGAVCFQREEHAEAIRSLRRSLHLRPASNETLQLFEAVTNAWDNGLDAENRSAKPDSETDAPRLSLNFDGDVLDLVSAARILSVYSSRGYSIEVQCVKGHEPMFQAAGATIVPAARTEWELARTPYRPAVENAKQWQVSNAGWNLTSPVFPRFGSAESLWEQYVQSKLDLANLVSEELGARVANWLRKASRPIVAVKSNTPVGENRSEGFDVGEFCQKFLERFAGTLILLDDPISDGSHESSRVKRITDLDETCSIEVLLAVLEHSDLLVAGNSLPVHLAALNRTPTIANWSGGEHPAQSAFPAESQLNLVLVNAKERSNPCWRIPWHIVEYAGNQMETRELLGHCAAMLGERRYLSSEKVAADCQLQHWIRSLCRQEIEGEVVRDRDRSLDMLFQEIRSRFDNPTIVETGTIRADDDWAGAGYFTWLTGAYVHHAGGIVHSVDIDPVNCMFAQKRCRPFGDRVKIHCDDSVAFLKKFNRPIDVLYCDSLDSYEPGFAQHALNEIVAAMPFLHESSLVVFDDSPTINGKITGKGTRAVPWLLDRGWQILFAGYQVILATGHRGRAT